MATFTNQATLTYNGISTNSNIAFGEILDVLSVTKTVVEDSYSQGDTVTYVVSLRNTGSFSLPKSITPYPLHPCCRPVLQVHWN